MKKITILLLSFLAFATKDVAAQSIDLQWIGSPAEFTSGASWGVPFKKGEVKESQQFTLTNKGGSEIPLQSWIMARHGDGSVKWMGFAGSVAPENAGGLKLNLSKTPGKKGGIAVISDADKIVITNSLGEFAFNKHGHNLIRHIKIGGTTVSENGRLVCMLENRSQQAENVIKYEDFVSEIKNVTLEQQGPVRAVVKIEGVHRAVKGAREWLPFVVRFYVYDNSQAVNMVHTIIFDGEQHTDYIKGLGVVFDVPLREEIHNRHIRFSGDDGGLWSESVQPLMGRRVLSFGDDNTVLARQVAGERIPQKEAFDEKGQYLMSEWAAWTDFTLSQLSQDGFTIRKRTNAQSSWVGTAGGKRSSGLVLAGDVSGGIAVSLKNFWQSFPAELEASNMRDKTGQVKVWMWSPKSEAMDLRHYDTIGHSLEASYEDYQEGLATPYGVSRTSELTIYAFNALPTKPQTAAMAAAGEAPAMLMASPKYLHNAGAFGTWSLPDKSTPAKEWIESQIDGYIDYYQKAAEQHGWYGFWNYGDVMHSYNASRHSWNYDIGGQAWANTELEPDLWLWYAFVRSARPDILKMAQAMTRHTSEVDMYHIGEMAGLGTRHNVSHWGCGAKEARIAQAWWKRFYYYLTTDERMGDIMHEVVDADYLMLKFDPLRIAQPLSEFPTAQPTRLRWGPDWIAFVGNWFTEWERTGNKKYLDKINVGMDCLSAMPNGLFTGQGPLGYDPSTGIITYEGDPSWISHTNHLAVLQGGIEVMSEVYSGVGNAKFNETYLMYSKFYGMPQDDPVRNLPENARFKDWWGHYNNPRLGALPAKVLADDHLAQIAWNSFFRGSVNPETGLRNITATRKVEVPDALRTLDENASIGTNGTAQWNLNAIIMLELIGDKIPTVEELKKRTEVLPAYGNRGR